ncbi:MAG: hypothetical protein H0T93_10390 [Chloroflexia bacterium]|nr:hypothetical protein [Chloroflexia bacterium]
MSNKTGGTLSRRTVTAAGTSVAAGLLATRGLSAAAHDATLEAGQATPFGDIRPLGYVSMRMRQYETAEIRDEVNDLGIRDFLPAIVTIDGFKGYLVGDVIHDPHLTFGVTVLEDREALVRSDEVAQNFVTQDHFDEHVVIEGTRRWAGDLLMLGTPAEATGTPAATVWDGNGVGFYVAIRVHRSLPNTDPRGFVREAIDGFLPIVLGLPGCVGYLWFPVEGGFVAISLYETEEAANESTEAARAWATEHLAEYTDGNPEVINASVVYADMPIFVS